MAIIQYLTRLTFCPQCRRSETKETLIHLSVCLTAHPLSQILCLELLYLSSDSYEIWRFPCYDMKMCMWFLIYNAIIFDRVTAHFDLEFPFVELVPATPVTFFVGFF